MEVTRIANIHYFEFTKEYHTFNDSHPFCELVFVDSGTISVNAENYSGPLTENQLIIHRSGEVHSLKCNEDNAPNVIIIGFECNAPQIEFFSSTPVYLSNEQQKLLSEIIKEGRSVFMPPYDVPNLRDMKKKKEYPFGADYMIKIKLECFLINLVRSLEISDSDKPDTLNDEKIYEIHNYITTNYRENISLNELCFLFGTNKTTLCNSFKKTYGNTIVNYINNLKIKKAKKLIREGVRSVTEISDELGFSSVHYFCRLFKKSEGKSPTEYMRTIKSRLED